ncbi:protein PBDC1-like isoform X2 [Clytia hemisphaerica]|uniref:protein PBDC1-like isoform X2 n=1 Tax=Clytia hemisphaerica TaxID=252671 RepID=UPI0034D54313
MADFESQLQGLGSAGALQVGAALQEDASNYTNTSQVEQFWALKTHKYAEVYMKLIETVDPKLIKLTKFDGIIYRQFKRYFKSLKIDVLNVDDFKSDESKKIWRKFCESFKGKVENYNFGSLLRSAVHL